MPSTKRSKENTWKEDELAKSLKAARSSSKSSKSKERDSSSHRDKDKEKDRSKHQDKEDKKSSRSDGKERRSESKKRLDNENEGKESGRSQRSSDKSSRDRDSREHKSSKEESRREGRDRSDKKRDGERNSDGKRDHDRTSEKRRTKDGSAIDGDSKDLEKTSERRKERPRDKDSEKRRERDGEREHRREKDRHKGSENRERESLREPRESKSRVEDDEFDRERLKQSKRRHREEQREDVFEQGTKKSDDKREKRRGKETEEERRERKDKERRERKERERGERDRDRRHEKKEHSRTQNGDEYVDKYDNEDSSRRRHRRNDRETNEAKGTAVVDTEELASGSYGSSVKNGRSNFETSGSTITGVKGDQEDQVDGVDYGNNNEDSLNYDYDDEQFEDYDDDFEEDATLEEDHKSQDSDSEQAGLDSEETNKPVILLTPSEERGMEQLKKAINDENERARSASRSPQVHTRGERDRLKTEVDSSYEEPSKPEVKSSLKGRINFVAAKAMQLSKTVAMKSKQRGLELSKLLELDAVSIHLFELAPTNEYELYMKNFGLADSAQLSVQACEERFDADNQTEDIETESKWCQHSSEVQASGAGEDVGKKLYQISSSANVAAMTTDTVRLNNFLLRASQVCLSLLDEQAADLRSNALEYQSTKTKFSESFVELDTSNIFIQGREIKSVSPQSSVLDVVLTAYGPSHFTKENADLAAKGLIVVWKPSEPNRPQRMLLCESTPSCCCFSSPRASFLFAGMDDGSLAVWDLGESPAFHMTRRARKESYVLYSTTFSTASVLATENHKEPIISVVILSQKQEGESKETVTVGSSKGTVGMSFQLATLDELGVINFWILVEVERPDAAGSEVDLGLSPGGKWKLSKTGSIAMGTKQRVFEPGRDLGQTTCFQVRLDDPNHFYIGTDKGHVVHLARFGERASPRLYKASQESTNTVTTMDVSPWNVDCFLVGYDNGVLRLYNFQNELPLLEWPLASAGAPYSSVKWSLSRPGVFFTLDDNNFLSGWDLLSRDDAPIWQDKMGQGKKKLSHFTLIGGFDAVREQDNVEQPQLVLFYEQGSIEAHRLSKSLTQMGENELDAFSTYIEDT